MIRSCSPTCSTPNRLASSDGHLDHRERGGGAALPVELQHLRVVHLVDVIPRQHDQLLRVLAKDRIQVLVHRVGGALIPLFANPLLRAENLDELSELVGDDAPSHADVTAQRQRLVLQGDEDPAQPGIDAVAQREVDDPVRPAEVDGRLGALLRQRIEAFSDATRQDHYETLVEHGAPFRFPSARQRRVIAARESQRETEPLGGARFGD